MDEDSTPQGIPQVCFTRHFCGNAKIQGKDSYGMQNFWKGLSCNQPCAKEVQ